MNANWRSLEGTSPHRLKLNPHHATEKGGERLNVRRTTISSSGIRLASGSRSARLLRLKETKSVFEIVGPGGIIRLPFNPGPAVLASAQSRNKAMDPSFFSFFYHSTVQDDLHIRLFSMGQLLSVTLLRGSHRDRMVRSLR